MSRARRLFGTDGVRGVAGETLTAELVRSLGRAAVKRSGASRPRVLVLRDTRESGVWLEEALANGIVSAGGDVLLAGVLPTPAAPILVTRHGLDLAVVISASHNPFRDNGIKFFGPQGFKLSDDAELEIEDAIEADDGAVATTVGSIETMDEGLEEYVSVLHAHFSGLDLSGLDVVLDCANGATFEVAPEIFRRLGAAPVVIAADPDGRNINDGCGSTHLDLLAERVVAGGHAIGFAFDGDGDRVLAVDRSGTLVDGDELIALAALYVRHQGRLQDQGVVVTVMSNHGFHEAMAAAGIEVVIADVGDRYVLTELNARGWDIGGEQSGHIIDMAYCPSGDGIAAALLTLAALQGEDLQARSAMTKLPQTLVNVPVPDRDATMASERVAAAVEAEHAALDGRGRVLVRASGTEQLVRVMVEAPTAESADAICARLVEVVAAEGVARPAGGAG